MVAELLGVTSKRPRPLDVLPAQHWNWLGQSTAQRRSAFSGHISSEDGVFASCGALIQPYETS